MTRELHSDCPNCASAMRFAAGRHALECGHCGYRFDIEASDDEEVRLFDFEQALENPERLRPFAQIFPDGHEVECDGCGARTLLEGQAGNCPYCGNPVLHEVPAEDLISPDSILPFAVTREQALAELGTWLEPCRLPEADLALILAHAQIDGVYLPYWSFNWRSTTFYRGKSGTQNPWFEKKIDWEQTGGAVWQDFENVTVSATSKLLLQPNFDLERWDSDPLQPFDPAFLKGFLARRYGEGLRQAFSSAVQARAYRVFNAIQSDIPGTECVVENMETLNENIRFRHCLLPVWFVRYMHDGYTYEVVIDGEIGQIAGGRPAVPEDAEISTFTWVLITTAVVIALFYFAFLAG